MEKEERLKYIHRLNNLTAEMNALYHQASLKYGISDSVSLVLYTICDKGDACRLSDIYKSNGVSKQTVNSAIRKLEAEGILYLIPDKGRSKRVVLTEKGHEMAEKTVMKIMDAEVRAFEQWRQEELQLHTHFMEQFLTDLQQTIKEL